jgi:renal tumor antigen
VQEIITKLLVYDQSSRMSASQALKHPYFRELREADKFLHENSIAPSAAMRLTKRAGDSFS